MSLPSTPAGPSIKRTATPKGGRFAIYAKMPWWFLLLWTTPIFIYTYTALFLPAFEKRSWAIPERKELVVAHGELESHRLNTTTPYSFIVNGNRIALFCAPFITKWNDCLAQSGLDLSSKKNIPADIEYFAAKDLRRTVNVLMNVTSRGSNYINYDSQVKRLTTVINIEDNRLFQKILSVSGSVFIWIMLLRGIYEKLRSGTISNNLKK